MPTRYEKQIDNAKTTDEINKIKNNLIKDTNCMKRKKAVRYNRLCKMIEDKLHNHLPENVEMINVPSTKRRKYDDIIAIYKAATDNNNKILQITLNSILTL